MPYTFEICRTEMAKLRVTYLATSTIDPTSEDFDPENDMTIKSIVSEDTLETLDCGDYEKAYDVHSVGE